MKLLTDFLKVLVILGLAAIPGRADIPDCVLFSASPDMYSAPVPDSFDPHMYPHSFTVYASYENLCEEPVSLFSGLYGIDSDPYVYSDLFPYGGLLDPGETMTIPHAGIVWLPETPNGYIWNGYIERGGLDIASFTAMADGYVHVECTWPEQSCHVTPITPVPEPGTLLLFGTGVVAVAARLRMGRHLQS